MKVGAKAPDFSLDSTSGGRISLQDLVGQRVVLYFYPKDDTPGCTREACDFRDSMARLEGKGAVILGVSRDPVVSHDKFRKKYGLPFHLLSDPDNRIASTYGAFGEKVLYGKKSLGTIRSTFVIDGGGRVERIWSPVKVEGHVDEVLHHLGGAASGKAAGTTRKAAGKKKTATKARAATSKTPRKKSTVKKAAPARKKKAVARRSARAGR